MDTRIEKWMRQGWRPKQIADKLRVHPSTIYRELKRGAYDRLNGDTWKMETAYSPDIAEEKYQAQLREKGPDLKIGKDHELAEYIERTILERDCSPAAVLGYAMMEGKKFKTTVSVQTIYKTLLFFCGDRRGRSVDYIQDGDGCPLNFCPECGKKLEGMEEF